MAYHLPPSSLATPHNFDSNSAAGRHAHLFQPPKSPTSSVNTSSFATATDYFSSGSRKRQRPDSSHGVDTHQSSTPGLTTTPSWQQCPTTSLDGSHTSTGASGLWGESMMVNERYKLAGGFDTPGLQATSGYFDRGADGQLSGPLARERNGVARMQSSPNGESRSTWTDLAFGLVAKAFSFGTTVFKGFYAGGGKGYHLSHTIEHTPLQAIRTNQEQCCTPLPGSWQENEFLGDFEQDNPSSPQATASRPPNKRRQTDKDAWVVVGTPDLESSPKRKVSSNSVPRSNLAIRPPASRASSRRSLAPLPRRQSSHNTYCTGSPAQAAHLIHRSPDRRASFASMRSNSRPSSSSGVVSKVDTTYLSPEAERYVKRRAKQEKQQQAAMTDLSRKIADLVRQGQTALATKISVEGDADGSVTDEGYVDEGW